MKRVLGANGLERMSTYVDASYATHMDTKSSKQKINTKRSTESEVIGASDVIPSTI